MSDTINSNAGLVIQKDKSLKDNINPIALIFGVFSIYSMIIPAIMMDLFLLQYQAIYFTVMGIPKINRDDYVVLDRYNLKGLNFLQKVNCIYCEYVNGVVAFAKEVANQTEIYSCAIKHSLQRKGQEHHKDFYEYSEFLEEKK